MKKSNKKNRASKPKTKGNQVQVVAKPERRRFLTSAGPVLGAAVVLGGLGFWGVSTVQASVAERDLTQVGQGTPTIVQVHDTQCSTCIALQREARIALERFDKSELDYRIADIKSQDGLAFASRYGAVHSTLLFFDAQGNLAGRLVGPNDSDALATAFTAHRDAGL